MKLRQIIVLAVMVMPLLAAGAAMAQTEQQAIALTNEAKALLDQAKSRQDLESARAKYQDALKLCERARSEKCIGHAANQIGYIHHMLGQYPKALGYYEKSLEITKKLGDLGGERVTLDNIASVYANWGQYLKALEYHEKSMEIGKKLGDLEGEGVTLNNIALVYANLGRYPKALEYYEKSLKITRRIGDAKKEGVTLSNIGSVYKDLGQYPKALEYYKKSLRIQKKIGVPYDGTEDSIGNVYLSMGELKRAEPILLKTKSRVSLGRLALAKSDFIEANWQFNEQLVWSLANGNVQGFFTGFTGLGLAYEGLQLYGEAATQFKGAIAVIEHLRDGLAEAQRANFYDVQVWNILRITPYEGLARVLAKMGKGRESFKEAEGTKARVFAESLSRRSQIAALDVPKTISDQDTELNNKLAAALQGAQIAYEKDAEGVMGSFVIIPPFDRQVTELRQERDRHVSKLRTEYPLFAATKYPQPMELQHTALKDDEWVLEYEVTEPGICIYLVHGKKIVRALFKPIQRKEVETLVRTFREPLEVAPGKDSIPDKLKTFDLAAGKRLADLLLGDVLGELPEGAPLIIVPDESLAVLPFEMLVLNTGGEVKTGGKFPSVSGAEFFGDRNAISYYQSVTALTLARTLQKRSKPSDRLLVMADPVFRLNDQRAQAAKGTRIAESDQKFYSQLMASMEDSGSGLRFGRLPLTGELAANLCGMFKGKSDSLVGLEASKENILKKVAPNMDRYGSVVFATHGYFNKNNPGFLEPILALTMVPPGTDGFLRMSEVMGLKLNADIVALTACQTGLGRNISGEGTMGMGRAFQYAGAKSVLMSLWNVEQKASVQLVETFFKNLKEGKKKLEALRLARQEIQDQGYDHPFFWASFILVGEVD